MLEMSGYGSEEEWFHVTAWKMNCTDEEYADTHLILGKACGKSDVAERLYTETFPSHLTPARHFEHQLWISASVLSPCQKISKILLILSLCVIPVFLKLQKLLEQNRDVALVHDSRSELRYCSSNYLYYVALGGLVVIVFAVGTKVRGFKPGQGRWIFKGHKTRQHAIFRRGNKAVCSMRQYFTES
jgi:hypothetical protein